MIIESQVKALEALATNLVNAPTIREKVRFADRIFAALSECEKLVEQFIVSDIAEVRGQRPPESPISQSQSQPNSLSGRGGQAVVKRFRDIALADIAFKLLTEYGTMHGLKIERLAKVGGFESSSKHFQSYLSVALKRKGGFENTGKNTWKINPSVKPDERQRDKSEMLFEAATPKVRVNGAPTRKTQLHDWLKRNGPATREQVLAGSGLPSGSASSILSVEKDLFQKRDDGRWHAL